VRGVPHAERLMQIKAPWPPLGAGVPDREDESQCTSGAMAQPPQLVESLGIPRTNPGKINERRKGLRKRGHHGRVVRSRRCRIVQHGYLVWSGSRGYWGELAGPMGDLTAALTVGMAAEAHASRR
jgi:hypothetical protein